MTLNEAINHCREVAENCDNKQCATDHLQLAGWLQELKELRNANEFNCGGNPREIQ